MAFTSIGWNGRGVIANCDALSDTAGGNWVELGGGGISANTDNYLLPPASIGHVYASKDGFGYYITPINYNFGVGGAEEGQLIYIWVQIQSASAFDLLVNNAFAFVVGTDTNNYRKYTLAGSGLNEGKPFDGGGWKLFVFDPTIAGTVADVGTFDLATINMVGLWMDTIVSVRADTIFIDQISIGKGLQVTGNGTISEIIDYCTDYTNRAWGVFQKRGSIGFAYGSLTVGDNVNATVDTTLTDDGSVVEFGYTEFWNGSSWALTHPADYNQINIEKHLSFATSYQTNGTSLFGSASAKLSLTSEDGTSYSHIGGALKLLPITTYKASDIINGLTYSLSKAIRPNGASMSNFTINSTEETLTGSLELLSASDLNTISNGIFGNYKTVSGGATVYWDITGAIHTGGETKDIGVDTVSPRGLEWNDDGTKLYIINDTAVCVIDYYTASAPYDVKTLVYQSSLNVDAVDNAMKGIRFSSDGLTMWTIGSNNDNVYEWTLSTAWLLSSATNTALFDVSNEDNAPKDLFFNDTGSKMYMIGTGTGAIYQYDLGTNFDITTANYINNSVSIAGQDSANYPTGLYFSSDGMYMYEVAYTDSLIYQYDLSIAWDLSTADYITNSISYNTTPSTAYGITFTPNGAKMFYSEDTTDTLFMVDLIGSGGSTDIGSAIYIPASVTGTITLDNFTGDGSGTDIYWAGTAGTLTVNKANGTNFTTWASAGGTVDIVSSVSIAINVKDQLAAPVVGALVYVDEDLAAAGEIVNTVTDVNGDVNTSYSGGAPSATVRVRKYGFKPYVGTISLGSDSTTNVTLITDPQQI